jgi:hypothetical protein
MLALAIPAFGADAGGALAASMAFALAFWTRTGKPIKTKQVVAAFGVGLCLLAVITLVDRAMPGTSRSHIGQAVVTGERGGLPALVQIAVRKIAMNARLTLSPWTFAAFAGLVPLTLWIARGRLGQRTRHALAQNPALLYVCAPSLWGAFGAFAFNDSGIVAALLLLAPLLVAVVNSLGHTD